MEDVIKDVATDAWSEIKEETAEIVDILRDEAQQGVAVMVKDGVKYLVKRAIHTIV